ncbi:MAG: hypothetical protein IJX18_02640 [Clostridia bacterium]|nr:hypothetical protein [Clostridia bacterium]
MATQGQIFYFLACVFFGFLGGFLWEIMSSFTWIFHKEKGKKVAKIVSDVLFFVVFGVLCAWISAYFSFPAPRAYMCVGYAFGLIIYLKSVKILLAFLKKVCYNTFIKKIATACKKVRKTDEEKL